MARGGNLDGEVIYTDGKFMADRDARGGSCIGICAGLVG